MTIALTVSIIEYSKFAKSIINIPKGSQHSSSETTWRDVHVTLTYSNHLKRRHPTYPNQWGFHLWRSGNNASTPPINFMTFLLHYNRYIYYLSIHTNELESISGRSKINIILLLNINYYFSVATFMRDKENEKYFRNRYCFWFNKIFLK